MVTKLVKPERKKTSRGQRKHVRRMKQEARRGNITDNQLKIGKRTQAAPKE